MQSNRDALQKAIDLIKRHTTAEGMAATNAEMAQKTGIPEKQWLAYLDREEDTPADLAIRLQQAYGIKTVAVDITETGRGRQSGKAQPNQEKNRTSLQHLITFLKNYGKTKGMDITDEQIAGRTGIPKERWKAYLDGTVKTPGKVVSKLYNAYTDLLTAQQVENNAKSLESTIVLIRNCGLAKGMDITIEDMARETGISSEQLINYLKDGYDAAVNGDISSSLRIAYKKLLPGKIEIEIVEDINMILAQK